MESQKQLLLNKKRYFGDVIGDAITFMKINFKPIGQAFLSYVVPFVVLPFILMALSGHMSKFLSAFTSLSTEPSSEGILLFYSYIGFMMLFWIIAYFFLNLIMYATFKAYDDNGNQRVSYRQVKDYISMYMGNYFVSALVLALVGIGALILVSILNGVVIMLVGTNAGSGGGGGVLIVFLLTFIIMLLSFMVFAWIFTSLATFSYIRIKEDLAVGDAWKRSFALIKKNWWSMFGILLVSSIIMSIASYAFAIPLYMVMFFGALSSADASTPMTGTIYLGAISLIFSQLGSMFLTKYVTACSTLKYYDLVEKKDGSSIAQQIDQLGESPDSFFENEGEY